MAKAKLSMMDKMKKQLEEPKAKPKIKAKKVVKKPLAKKETEMKTPTPIPREEKTINQPSAKTALEGQIPRGERGDFLKTTLTIPASMLTELRALGMRRKSNKQKDTDTSALVREALTDFLNKHRSN